MDRNEIAPLLPEILQRTIPPAVKSPERNVLWALLGVMEQLHQRDETILHDLDCYFHPNRIPERAGEFLPFLAGWVDLDWLLPESGEYEAGPDCLRSLILSARWLAPIRGTRQGLMKFLEMATGVRGFRVEEVKGSPFCIRVTYPPEAEKYRALVERIVAGEKPAYVKCEIQPVGQGNTAGEAL